MTQQPLRIAADARCLDVARIDGAARSMREMIKRTASSGAVDWQLLVERPGGPACELAQRGCEISILDPGRDVFRSWEQWYLPRRARQLGADILHAPATAAPWWQPVPTVVTVQDASSWRDGAGGWPPGFYRDRLLPAALGRAAAVITASDSSRAELLARWPGLQPRLHAVSPGIDERYLDVDDDGSPIQIGHQVVEEPYLLYVGGTDPRKRLLWALQAWWRAAGASLVVCGVDPSEHDNIRRMVPAAFVPRLVLAPFVPQSEMPRLFMRATAVLYPALYESAGLVAIEAQAAGTPVLFSDVGALSELKGPAAVVLPVDDMPAWERTVANLLAARPRAHGADRLSREWARQYSWDAHTDRMLTVYRSVAEAGLARPSGLEHARVRG